MTTLKANVNVNVKEEMVQVLLAEGTQGMKLKSKVHGKAEKAKNAEAGKAEAGKAEAEPPGAVA
jgi:hypothetical protein